MFAVQGWNVPTTKLVQEHTQRTPTAGEAGSGNTLKKRKRADRDVEKARKIQASELEKLWDQQLGKKHTTPKHKFGNDAVPKIHNEQKVDAGAAKSSNNLHKKEKIQSVGKHQDSSNVNRHIDRDKNRPGHRVDKHSRKGNASVVKPGPNNQSKESRSHDYISTPTSDARAHSIAINLPPPPPPATNLTPLQAKMRSKLTSARFRHLNETLYTTSSSTALSLFTTSPHLFAEYHAGFSQQVSSSWPRNPVEDFISAIKARGPLNLSPSPTSSASSSSSITPLPRRKTQSCTIADLGCGDAPLARALIPGHTKKLHLTIHSYDLYAPNSHVTVADIANLPLRDGEADIAIFCLSLMGTNWIDFVEEAWRVLRGDGKGEVWVAEVKSRFARPRSFSDKGRKAGEPVAHSVGKRQKPVVQQQQQHQQKGKIGKKRGHKSGGSGANNDTELVDDDAELPPDLFTGNDAANQNSTAVEGEETTPDLGSFINVFTRRGFQLKPNSIDAKNKMFVSMTFFKSGIPTVGKQKGMKWTGKQYERMGKGGESDDETERAKEAEVLKPCVYKTR